MLNFDKKYIYIYIYTYIYIYIYTKVDIGKDLESNLEK